MRQSKSSSDKFWTR